MTYLAFPIAELPAKPDKVSLRVYITQSGTNATYADTELQLHASENLEWSETETVWNNKPAIEPDMLAAFKPGNIHEDNPNSAPVWADLDVTDYITAAKAAERKRLPLSLPRMTVGQPPLVFPLRRTMTAMQQSLRIRIQNTPIIAGKPDSQSRTHRGRSVARMAGTGSGERRHGSCFIMRFTKTVKK